METTVSSADPVVTKTSSFEIVVQKQKVTLIETVADISCVNKYNAYVGFLERQSGCGEGTTQNGRSEGVCNRLIH